MNKIKVTIENNKKKITLLMPLESTVDIYKGYIPTNDEYLLTSYSIMLQNNNGITYTEEDIINEL